MENRVFVVKTDWDGKRPEEIAREYVMRIVALFEQTFKKPDERMGGRNETETFHGHYQNEGN